MQILQCALWIIDTYKSYDCNYNIDPQCNAKITDISASSLYLSENSSILSNVASSGKIYQSNNSKITGAFSANSFPSINPYENKEITSPTSISPMIITGNGTKNNPYVISVTGCSSSEIKYHNNVYVNIKPGCYKGIDISNNANITLSPGTYYIRSHFIVGNNAVINALEGSSILFVGDYAIDIQNNATLNIVAPNFGYYSGIALMGDPNGKETIVQTFSNNAIINVKGAIYFKNQIINMENNTISSNDGCLQIIARRVLFSNNAVIGSKCFGVGISPISYGQIIVEVPHFVNSIIKSD